MDGSADTREQKRLEAALESGAALPSCSRRRGTAWRFVAVALVLVAAMAAGAGYFFWLVQGERNSAFLREHFLALVQSGLGPGNQLVLNSAGLTIDGTRPTFTIEGLQIRNPETGASAELERADVTLSRTALWRFSPEAKAIRFDGLRFVLPASIGGADPLSANEIMTLARAAITAAHVAISGDDQAFRAIERIDGEDITLLRREPDGRQTMLQTGLVASLQRVDEHSFVAMIGRKGNDARIQLRGQRIGAPDGTRVLALESDSLTAGAVFGLLGDTVQGIDPRLGLVIRAHARQGGDGQTFETALSLGARGGRIDLPDPDIPAFHLDESAIDLRFRAGSDDVTIDRLQIRFDEVNILAHGTFQPSNAASGAVKLNLVADRLELGRLSPRENVLAIDRADLDATIARDLLSIEVHRFDLAEGAGQVRLSGRAGFADGGRIEIGAEASDLDFRAFLRIWPIWVAPRVRDWFVSHAEAGRVARLAVRSLLAGETLRAAFNHQPLPAEALDIRFKLEDIRLRPILGAPPIEGILAEGTASARNAEARIESGFTEPRPGQRVDLADVKLAVADTTLKPATLDLTLPARGRLDGLIAYLSTPSLQPFSGLPAALAITDGQFEGRATIRIPLAASIAAKDVRSDFRAELRRVAIDNVAGEDKLEGGNFQLNRQGSVTHLRGEGRVSGIPGQIEMKVEAGKPAIATFRGVLDETQLQRRGIDLRPALTGPVGVAVNVPLGSAAPGTTEIELNLIRAKIETSVPGIDKKPGQAGRARFLLTSRQDSAVLEDFELDFGAISARGRIDIQRGQFSKAELSALKLSAGDNMRGMIERSRGGLRIALKGNSFDMRPFSRSLQSGNADENKTADLDLDLDSTVLVGHGGELMSGASLRLVKRQGSLAQFSLKGQFGGAPISAAMMERQSGAALIKVDSADGGALFRFLDIYTKMYGGRMNAELLLAPGSQQGVVQMRDFFIRGEPAFRQAGAGSSGTSVPSASQTIPQTDNVQFTKLRADFVRQPGRLDLKEGVMWGPQVGGTLEGMIDYARDQVSLKGAFVPAYALNNLFAQVPIVGRLLGGGQYEGLFAVPFVITGRASQPVMRVNPVSAIAPGFLRKFFEIQREQ